MQKAATMPNNVSWLNIHLHGGLQFFLLLLCLKKTKLILLPCDKNEENLNWFKFAQNS